MNGNIGHVVLVVLLQVLVTGLQAWQGAGGPALIVGGVAMIPILIVVLRALNLDPPPVQKAQRLARKLMPPLSLLSMAILIACAGACSGCAGGTITPQTATDIGIGVQATACLIMHSADDLAAGMTPGQIVADLVAKCGLTVAQVATLFDAEAYKADKLGDAKGAASARVMAASARSPQ